MISSRCLPALIGLVALAACGIAPSPGTATGGGPLDQPAAPLVAVTGFPAPNDPSELCPDLSERGCAGVLVAGDVPSPEEGERVRVVGYYDGRALTPTLPPETLPVPRRDFTTPCQELRVPRPGVNADPATDHLVAEARRLFGDRVAAVWWDERHQVMNIWVVGDPEPVRRELGDPGTGDRLCVVGGARHSEQQLQERARRAVELLESAGVGFHSVAVDGLANQIEVSMDRIDPPTRGLLEAELGESLEIHAFLEVLDATLADLPDPVPAVEGDVDLVTQEARGGGGMAALGRFRVAFDPDLRCVYLLPAEGPQERVLPVWPFGYTAAAEPLRVFDHDGAVVAREGQLIEWGGGEAGIGRVDAGEDCGAGRAWIGNGSPRPAG